jgi:Cu+-exporting ATPase
VPPEWEQHLARLDQQGQTPLFVALSLPMVPAAAIDPATRGDQPTSGPVAAGSLRIVGLIGVCDTPRPEAPFVIRELKALGIRSIAVLTGDRRSASEAMTRDLSEIGELGAELLPADKARWVERSVASGRRVAMIGDGVNDAPALAAATVGLALGGTGSDLAAEAGDIILMGAPLAPLPGLVRLSRQMVRVIQQGIYLFAFGVNGLGVVLCAWGVLNPVGGALFHEFASLAVMLNSLRLLWFERWDATSLGRRGAAFGQAAEWLADRLSPTRVIHLLVVRRHTVVRLAFAVVAVWYLTSNCVLLTEDEQALVTRYGRYETTLGAGLAWRWPAPFERIRREKVDRIRTVQLGFRSERGAAAAAGEFSRPIEWDTEHSERGYLVMPAESALLSGDEVAVELTAEAHYRIRNLREYVEGTNKPEALLRAAVEGATRQVVAARALDEILAQFRADVEADCLRRLREIIVPYKLGVEITGFALLDVHPPPKVVPAYRDVANALEEQEQAINTAQAQYARMVLSTAGERAVRLLSEGEAPAQAGGRETSTSGAIADWNLTDDLWAKLSQEDADGRMLLSGKAAARLNGARREATRSVTQAEGQEARFTSLVPISRAEPALTRVQLYWETMERALAEKSMTILDPHASGRTHLYMADPERFNLNPLNLAPLSPSSASPASETPRPPNPEQEP